MQADPIPKLFTELARKIKFNYVMALLIISLSILTLALRGSVPEKTYASSEIPSSHVQAAIVSYGSSERNLKADRVPGNLSYVSNEPFQAVVIELPRQYEPKEAWSIRWAAVTYVLTSSSEFEYEMFLLSRSDELRLEAQGAPFLSHKIDFIDIYRLDASTKGAFPCSEELPFLTPLLGNFSIAIIKSGFGSEGFLTFKLYSVEIMSSMESVRVDLTLASEKIVFITVGMVVAVIIVPALLLLVLNSRLKLNPRRRRDFIFLAGLLTFGVLSRLVLAPLTGHPYDMEVWTQSVRLFYESGITDIRLFPLPLTYYLLLLAYSPYTIIRILGFQDTTFLAHGSRMLESAFIKAPFMLSDVLSLYFLFKIFNKLNGSEHNFIRGLTYALMYFLNPLAITLSSVWGMYDGIAVALFLAGIYYALLEEKEILGALFYTLSGLTKAFGFLGLIPLSIDLMRRKKFSPLLAMLGMIPAVSVLLYLPLLSLSGIQGIPELFIQFLRGRAGLGSKGPYIASGSYISYLSILGINIEPTHLTYLLTASAALISAYYGLKMQKSMGKTIELTLPYFAAVFFVFYLTFFRVYEHYYLWVIPVLLMYSYLKGASGPRFAALYIALAASPIILLSTLLTGVEYYWVPLNMPADASIVAVLPSTLAALSLISIVDLKGPLAILKTGRGMSASAGITLWFSFGLAYYTYYRAPFLGVLWYPISLIVAFMAVVFSYKRFGLKMVSKGAAGAK